MFSKLALLTAAFMAAVVSASIENSCNTGATHCCEQVQDAKSTEMTALLALIGVAAEDVTAQVGLQCSPITAVGAGAGSSCTQQPVCCTSDYFNSLIGVGCTPIAV